MRSRTCRNQMPGPASDAVRCPILSGAIWGIRVLGARISQKYWTSWRKFSSMARFDLWTENPRVGGSIPPLATINSDTSAMASSMIG
jgi:hypothetical protein